MGDSKVYNSDIAGPMVYDTDPSARNTEVEIVWPDAALVDGRIVRGEDARVVLDKRTGTIAAVGRAPFEVRSRMATSSERRMPGVLLLPGMVSAHSHSFQRDLRGAGEAQYRQSRGKDDFWAWRKVRTDGLMFACEHSRARRGRSHRDVGGAAPCYRADACVHAHAR